MKDSKSKFVSATELLNNLFEEILITDDFDAELVAITKIHLGVASPHSKAGNNLAKDLIKIAKQRADGGEK